VAGQKRASNVHDVLELRIGDLALTKKDSGILATIIWM
jgi:hypothetical protein